MPSPMRDSSFRHRILDARSRARREGFRNFAGMGARNGVMAATMVAMGFSGSTIRSADARISTPALSDNPAPEKLIAELGTRFDVFGTTLKKWSVGSPLQSVLDSVSALLADPAVRADNIRHIRVDVPTVSLRIVDNARVIFRCSICGHDEISTVAPLCQHSRPCAHERTKRAGHSQTG